MNGKVKAAVETICAEMGLRLDRVSDLNISPQAVTATYLGDPTVIRGKGFNEQRATLVWAR